MATRFRAGELLRQTAFLWLGLLLPLLGWGQVTITPGGVAVTQNFNSIGTGTGAILPGGFKILIAGTTTGTVRTVGSYSASGATSTLSNAIGGSSTSASFTTAGTYNYGAGTDNTSTDRAVGALGSGSVSSVTLFEQFQNSSSTTGINSLSISYGAEKYRLGTNASGFSIVLYYSTDGTNWTAAGSNFNAVFAGGDANNNSFVNAPGATILISNQALTLPATVAAGGTFYLAWNYSATSGSVISNAQGLGIDDISITANGTTTPTTPTVSTSASALDLGSTVSGTASTPKTYNVSGTNLTSNIVVTAPNANVEVSLSSGSGYAGSVSVAYGTGTVTNVPIYVRIAAGAAAGTTISGNVTNVSGSATTQNVALSGSVTATPTPNPVPTITGLSPATAVAGSGDFTLTVNGTNFVSSSTATFNGISRTVAYVSATQLTVAVLAADIAAAGSYNVAVTNPTPGGGTTAASTASTFTVTAAPATTTLLQYSFTGSGTTAADAPPASSANVMGGGFSNGNNIARTTTANAYVTTNYSNTATTPATGEYLQFSITPTATYQVSLATLNYDDQSAAATKLPLRNAQVQYSTSNTFASFVALSTEAVTTSLTTHTIALSSVVGLQNVPAGNTIYFRVYPYNTTNGSATYTIDNVKLLGTIGPVVTTVYYTKPTGDLNTLATFGTNPDGSGTQPTSFAASSSVFNVSGTNRSFTANWVVSGSGSKVVLTAGASLVVPTSFAFTGTLDQLASSTLVLQNATVAGYSGITQGVQDASSTIDFAQTGTYTLPASSVLAMQNVRITNGTKTFAKNGGSVSNPTSSTVIAGNLLIDGATGVAGSGSTPFTTVELSGNLTLVGTAAFSSTPSTRLTLTMAGTGTQTITGNGSIIYLFRLRTGAGNNNVVLAGSTTPVEVGNASSGGVELFDGSTLSLNGNTLSSLVGGKAAFNSELQSDGTITFSPTSSLLMQTTASNIGYLYPTPGASTLNNLTITTASGDDVRVMGSDLTVNGALTLTSTASGLNFTGRTLTLNGTIAGNGVLYGDATSNLVVGGTGALGSLAFASGYQLLNNLTLNRTASGTVTLGTPLTVGSALTLTNGLLNTTATNLLTLADGATVNASANTDLNNPVSYVNGPLARTAAVANGSFSLLFPIGKAGKYRPLTLAATNQVAASTYTATQTEGNAGQSFATGSNLKRVSTVRYFAMASSTTTAGNFTGSITLSYGSDDYVNKPNDPGLVIAKRDATGTFANQWTNIGHGGDSGGNGNGPGGNPVAAGTLTSGSFSNFSDFTLGATNDNPYTASQVNPLPVELTSFAAQRGAGSGSAVTLRWTTASEHNSQQFVVERSLDGQAFAPVAEVAAAGTSLEPRNYAATDADAPSVALYYRLHQLDLDGSGSYSAVVAVTGSGAARAAYPNPTTGLLTVPGLAGQSVEVLDALGRSVRRTMLDATEELNLSSLPAGLYLLRLPGQRVQRIQKN